MMNSPHGTILGLDIGGANLKACSSDGDAHSQVFHLWKHPERLSDQLESLLQKYNNKTLREIRVTTTAELCDCFSSKSEGVIHVVESIANVRDRLFPQLPLRFWGIPSSWLSREEALQNPLQLAAGNWLAQAEFVARSLQIESGLLLDVGSTTIDLVPLIDQRAQPKGLTDTERLIHRELLYMGVRRTPVFYFVKDLPYRSRRCPVIPELFATLSDALLVQGWIPEDSRSNSTADQKPFTIRHSVARLGRVIGCDLETFNLDDAKRVSEELIQIFLNTLTEAIQKAVSALPSRPMAPIIILSGEGESLLISSLRERIQNVRWLTFSDKSNLACSESACAYALTQLPQPWKD